MTGSGMESLLSSIHLALHQVHSKTLRVQLDVLMTTFVIRASQCRQEQGQHVTTKSQTKHDFFPYNNLLTFYFILFIFVYHIY